MKKSLIALAALAAAGVASAQSSVTLFGIVDANYNNVRADANSAPDGVSGTAFKAKVSRLTDSGYNSSRLGFRGTEDLGGGMSAGFWLEAGLNNDNGTGDTLSVDNRSAATGGGGLTFNRRSTVSLAGNWGEVRLGRDYVPAFWNHTVFDPFGTNGVGAVNNMSLSLGGLVGMQTTVRASNSVGYFLPGNLGGFYGQLMYALGEVVEPAVAPVEKNDGRHIGARFGYAAGPFNVAYGYGETRNNGALGAAAAVLGFTGTDGKYRNQNLGGQWDFGVAKLLAQWNEEKVTLSGDSLKHRTYMIGTLVPVGAGEIRASYTWGKADDDVIKGRQLAVGYVHNLSKRTAVYATYSALNNSGDIALLNYSMGVKPTALDGDSRGFDIGIRHSF